MNFMTTKQAAEIWGISQRRVSILCEQGRINGAKKAGTMWLIPPDAVKPDDGRIKSERAKRGKSK
jgi:excisionase family DNA binding protein